MMVIVIIVLKFEHFTSKLESQPWMHPSVICVYINMYMYNVLNKRKWAIDLCMDKNISDSSWIKLFLYKFSRIIGQ